MKRHLFRAARWSERLVDGLDPQAAAAFERWTADPDNADALQRVMRTRALAADLAATTEMQGVRRQTLSRVRAGGQNASPVRLRALAAAAALALTIGMSAALLLVPDGEGRRSAASPVWTATYTTLTGQSLAHVLPDGSRITLDTDRKSVV